MRKGWTDTGYFTIVLNCVLEDESLSAKARFLYVLLVRYGRWKKVGNENYLVTWVGRGKLSDLTGESSWSVSQRIKELCDKGLIERRRRTCTSSHTYLCDPRSIYVSNTPVPDDDSPEEAEDYPTLELEEKEEKEEAVSVVGTETDVSSVPECDVAGPMTGIAEKGPMTAPIVNPPRDSASDKDTNDSDMGWEEAKPRARVSEEPPEKTVDMPLTKGLKGLLRERAKNHLTNKTISKVGVPEDALATDAEGDSGNARMVWVEFQQAVASNYSGYDPKHPTWREIGNCKKLLELYEVEDLIALFEMVATRWPVIREKWPNLAKNPLPTFYATYTLSRELVSLIQSGKGLTSRTHRYDANAADKAPDVGWGKRK